MPTDPPGARYNPNAWPDPAEPWSYILDDENVRYRQGLVPRRLRDCWWPFAYISDAREQTERHRTVPAAPPDCGVAVIWLAPDTKYWAWGNQIAVVSPDRHVPHLAALLLDLRVRPVNSDSLGRGAVTVSCDVRLDLAARRFTVDPACAAWPAALRDQAAGRAAKALAYLLQCCAEWRDSGQERTVTAQDLHHFARRPAVTGAVKKVTADE